jgi:hypothetical protein
MSANRKEVSGGLALAQILTWGLGAVAMVAMALYFIYRKLKP